MQQFMSRSLDSRRLPAALGGDGGGGGGGRRKTVTSRTEGELSIVNGELNRTRELLEQARPAMCVCVCV